MLESRSLFNILARDTLGGGDEVCVCVCIIGLLRLIENGYRGESLLSVVQWVSCGLECMGEAMHDLHGGILLGVGGVSDLECVR